MIAAIVPFETGAPVIIVIGIVLTLFVIFGPPEDDE